MNKKQVIRLTESDIHRIVKEAVNKVMNEGNENEILRQVHSLRSNILDFTEDGYGVLYIDYDPQTNELYAGGATNSGIIRDYSIQYDPDFSIDQNIEALVEEIFSNPPTDDTSIGENKRRIHRIMNESVECDDFAEISDALAECGWSYTDGWYVKNRKTGEEGYRYIIEKYERNPYGVKPCDIETLKQKMAQFFGEGHVIFTEGQHKYTPKIKNLSMVVF